jgi:hypothetical protein
MSTSCLVRCFRAGLLGLALTTIACSDSGPGASPTPPPVPGASEQLTVTAVIPSAGSAGGGQTVNVAGTGFRSGVSVTLNGNPAQVRAMSDRSISVLTPPSASGGPVDVVVTNPNGEIGRLPGGFTYIVVGPPSISGISAEPGSSRGGGGFKIQGSGFETGARVSFGGVGTAAALSGGDLVGMAPAHPAGTVDVTVTNPSGASDTLRNAYTYVDPGSLDFNGEWEGWGNEGETAFRFTIRNNLLTAFSCGVDVTIAVSSEARVSDGTISLPREYGQFTGRIVTNSAAVGEMRIDRCSPWLHGWSAAKR